MTDPEKFVYEDVAIATYLLVGSDLFFNANSITAEWVILCFNVSMNISCLK